ncbi:MAG: DUF4364 family protein [Lachnospiraceae bacterium]|nr:DUF4364 family protein [Lachnospiraceae bacterium]
MNHDQLALYNKILVLYMLNRVSFPLTQAQIYDFLLERNYVNFMNLQRAITELVDTGFVTARSRHNRTYLTITAEGRETLDFFKSRIDSSIRKDIDDFLGANQFKLRNETSVFTDYNKVLSGDYEVHLTVKEKDVTVVEITLSVPNQETAETVCTNWQKKNQDLYQYLAGQLF